MNKWILRWRCLFSDRCCYWDHCRLYQRDHFTCNHEKGSWCGACRMFDELDDDCRHYKEKEK